MNNETPNLAKIAPKAAATRDAMRSMADAINNLRGTLPRSTSLPMLGALNVLGKHVYAGTVPAATVETRRRRNKVARAQRRVNRQRNFRKGVR